MCSAAARLVLRTISPWKVVPRLTRKICHGLKPSSISPVRRGDARFAPARTTPGPTLGLAVDPGRRQPHSCAAKTRAIEIGTAPAGARGCGVARQSSQQGGPGKTQPTRSPERAGSAQPPASYSMPNHKASGFTLTAVTARDARTNPLLMVCEDPSPAGMAATGADRPSPSRCKKKLKSALLTEPRAAGTADGVWVGSCVEPVARWSSGGRKVRDGIAMR